MKLLQNTYVISPAAKLPVSYILAFFTQVFFISINMKCVIIHASVKIFPVFLSVITNTTWVCQKAPFDTLANTSCNNALRFNCNRIKRKKSSARVHSFFFRQRNQKGFFVERIKALSEQLHTHFVPVFLPFGAKDWHWFGYRYTLWARLPDKSRFAFPWLSLTHPLVVIDIAVLGSEHI